MKYELVVVGDECDADYLTKISVIDETDLPMLFKAVEAIRKHNEIRKTDWNHYNWARGEIDGDSLFHLYGRAQTEDEEDDQFDEDGPLIEEIMWFKQFVPYSEIGIHTIDSISYYPLPDKVKLL